MSEKYYIALAECCGRYQYMALVAQDKKLFEFISTEFYQGICNRAPLCKLNRWLGYIQGTLIAHGQTTVEAERDWTRPLFRPLDFPND